MEINNLKQVTKDLEKFKKAFGDELLMAASEHTKQFAQDLYASLKDQFETIVVKSESKSKPESKSKSIHLHQHFTSRKPNGRRLTFSFWRSSSLYLEIASRFVYPLYARQKS